MSESFLATLAHDLAAPSHRVDLPALFELWHYDDVRVVCVRPPDLEECPDLSMRIRGAWGRALAETARFRRPPDPFGRAAAWMGLWGEKEHLLTDAPPPYVVHADLVKDRIHICVRLFGCSRMWSREALKTLVSALESGIRLKTPRGIFVPLRVDDAVVSRVEGVARPAPGMTRCDLRLLSATAVRRKSRVVLSPASIIMSAVQRAAAVAPWMDLQHEADSDALRSSCAALSFDMSGVRPTEWTRYSQRQGSDPIPVRAIEGHIRMSGNLDPIAPYLILGELTGLGSSTASGYGRIKCILF